MDTTDTNGYNDGGNTISPSSSMRRVVFTLNNYLQEEMDTLIQKLRTQNHDFIVGREIGASGTPHLQGYIEFKNPKQFSTVKKMLPRAHLEKAKGNRNQNIEYCSKEGDFVSSFPPPPLSRKERILNKEYKDIEWRHWQQTIINLVESEPDSRSIHWFYEPTGNVGKSFLCKYLCLKYDCILADGKKDNVLNQVKTFMDENPEKDPRVILLDVPRVSQDYINYGVIEQLKNGCVYSGKYEGGQLLFEYPHVIVFANEPPETIKMSRDRWKITRI